MNYCLMKLLLLIIFLTYALSVPKSVHANESVKESLVALSKTVHAKDLAREARIAHAVRVRKVEKYLAANNSPLESNARAFVDCAESNGLNPGLLVGISRAESTLGRYYQLPNNPFNFGVHLGLSFRTMEDATCTVARKLKENYDTTTTLAIAKRYAPSSDGNSPTHWAFVVDQTIREVNL